MDLATVEVPVWLHTAAEAQSHVHESWTHAICQTGLSAYPRSVRRLTVGRV